MAFAEERSTGDGALGKSIFSRQFTQSTFSSLTYVWGLHQTRAAGPLSHQGLLQTQPAHPRLRVLQAETLRLAPGPGASQPYDILELLQTWTLHAPEAYSGSLCDFMSVGLSQVARSASRYCKLIGSAEIGCGALLNQHLWESASRGAHGGSQGGMQQCRGTQCSL